MYVAPKRRIYIFVFLGFLTYLAIERNIPIPPDQDTYCRIGTTVSFTSMLCSSMLIVIMTFDRFYSIIQPHKAASFNTKKRAKATIFCIIVGSILYNVPHLFLTDHENWQCLPYGKAMESIAGEFYYWFSFVIQFVLPFVSILSMNSVIIHRLRIRASRSNDLTGQSINPDPKQKTKSSEGQVFAILLLVSFGFLILTTPAYAFFLYVMLVNFFFSPQAFAGYYLFYSVASKLQFTNYGINFFFYVISGKKFRTDLLKLFEYKVPLRESVISNVTDITTS